MINHENYLAVKAYIEYQAEVMQRDKQTVQRDYGWLKHLLRWADSLQLAEANHIRPIYPQYLLSATTTRPYGESRRLAKKGVESACSQARMFFEWARVHLKGFRHVEESWIETIRAPRMGDEPRKEHQAVTPDVVRQLLAVPCEPTDLATRRDKAAAAFLFLSGARAMAFCTLNLECVNIAERTVTQYPTMGVKTKNRKSAVTSLLDIPDLLEVVSEWDTFLRSRLPLDALWFPVIDVSLGETSLTNKQPGDHRDKILRKGIKKLFDQASLPPMSPHKFRHGHALFGLKAARDVSELKAVSQNLMHANIGITDSIYAVLSDSDIRDKIASLGKGAAQGQVTPEGIEAILREALEKLTKAGAALPATGATISAEMNHGG